MPESGAEILARIQPTLREHYEHICLRPDLLDEWEELNTALTQSRTDDAANQRLGTGVSARTRKLAEQVLEVEAQIEAGSVKFHFRAMATDQWEDFIASHPPRKDDNYDLIVGYNRKAVSADAVRRCLVDPVFDDESWAQLRGVVPPGEWEALQEAVGMIHPKSVALPKSVAAAEILSRSANGSKRLKRGASPQESSTAGSAKKSTSTTTSRAG